MEEQVGALWHRLVTRLAETRFPEAAVHLPEVEQTVGILFRALGGDGGLQISSAEETEHGARRNWLQRLAGTHRKAALAWRDVQYLRLPAVIDWLPERALNRDLYLWLAGLAASSRGIPSDWFLGSQHDVIETLRRFPGLEARYRRLVEAHVATRPRPEQLSTEGAAVEAAIRAALDRPGTVARLPAGRHAPHPVPLWLHPNPPGLEASVAPTEGEGDAGPAERRHEVEQLHRQAERVESPEADRGLVTIRMENILTWGEFVKVDRGSEDEEDAGRAEEVVRDLDRLAISRGGKRSRLTLKFDLDLPPEDADDPIQSGGMLVPEWNWKQQRLVPNHCRIVPMVAAEAPACELPQRLRGTAKRLRAQFQALAPARVWHRAQPDGQDIDLDAYLRYASDRAAGLPVRGDRLYRELRSGARDLVCALIADLSLSTDTWVDDRQRVIDVIRDSLFLFAESLAATGDRFGLYGFSSRKRDPVRVHLLKEFDDPYDTVARGRIQAIRPGYYTRMGAALRYGARRLADEPGGRRLLLLLSDGKPNDLDQYEGRYGIEDTRKAVIEARQLGLQPFCVTIDTKGNDYLPYLFGKGGYVVIREPSELPRELPLLYARLTR